MKLSTVSLVIVSLLLGLVAAYAGTCATCSPRTVLGEHPQDPTCKYLCKDVRTCGAQYDNDYECKKDYFTSITVTCSYLSGGWQCPSTDTLTYHPCYQSMWLCQPQG